MTLPVYEILKHPPDDNGRGLHWTSSEYHGYLDNSEQYERWRAYLAALFIKWLKILDTGGGSSEKLIHLCAQMGIVPVVRFYRPEPNPGHILPDREGVTAVRFRDICEPFGILPIFECNNEPNLKVEWRDGHIPDDWIQIVLENWLIDCDILNSRGVTCGFPAFAPGSNAPGGNEITNIFKIGLDLFGTRFTDAMANNPIFTHNYALNHPLDYPFDPVNQEGRPMTEGEYRSYGDPAWVWDNQPLEGEFGVNAQRERDKNPGATIEDDWYGFRGWELWRDWALEVLPESPPIICTEGGLRIANRDDGRYPRTTPEIQTERTMAIETYMMDEAPAEYLATCHWLAGDAEFGKFGQHGEYTSWESQGWWTYWWRQQFGFDGVIPIVNSLIEAGTRPRANGGGIPTDPDQPPHPEPDPPPPSETELVNVPAKWVSDGTVSFEAAPTDQDRFVLRRVEWKREKEHVFVTIEDINGVAIPGALFEVSWPDGNITVPTKYGEPGNYPLFGMVGSYDVQVAGQLSDIAHGLGLGIPEAPGYSHHASWWLWFRRVSAQEPPYPPPPEPPAPNPEITGMENITDSLAKHPTKVYGGRPLEEITTVVVHHTGQGNPQSVATPEGTAQWFVNEKNYPGMSYTIWVPRDGGPAVQVQSMHVEGWHCKDCNKGTLGIVLEGNFWDGPDPNDVQLLRAKEAIDLLQRRLDRQLIIKGHKELTPPGYTVCPGRNWKHEDGTGWWARIIPPWPPHEPPGDCPERLAQTKGDVAQAMEDLQRAMGR